MSNSGNFCIIPVGSIKLKSKLFCTESKHPGLMLSNRVHWEMEKVRSIFIMGVPFNYALISAWSIWR